MSVVIQPPWASQPKTAVGINRGNPLTRGLIHAFLPSVSGVLYDCVKRQFAIPTSILTTLVGTPTPAGQGQRHGNAGGTSYQSYQITTETTAGGIYWLGERVGTGPAIIRTDSSSSTATVVWDDGANHFDVRLHGSGNQALAVGSFPANTVVDFLLTGDATAANGAFYSGGGLTASLTATAWGMSSALTMDLHFNTGNANGVDAIDCLLLVWDRLVTAQEYAALHQNPWQVFAPPSRSILSGFAAGGDITVGATGVAGTGAVGSVGVSFGIPTTGVAGTGSVGTMAEGDTLLLASNVGTGSVGTVSPGISVGLTGVAGTGAVGNLVPAGDVTVGATGVVGTGAVGTMSVLGAAAYFENSDYYQAVGAGLYARYGHQRMASWNAGGRPASPVAYEFGFNTDTSKLEVWTGAAWVGVLLS